MKSFKTFTELELELPTIDENFKNFIGDRDRELKAKWSDRVWNILQKSYAPIGGIKGNGFATKEDMIEKIPFWKIFTRGEDVKTVAMYKDRAGRKGVAYGTDGSDEGSKFLAKIFAADLDKSFTEISGPVLGFLLKRIGFDALRPFFIAKTPSDDVVIPDDAFVKTSLDAGDQRAWAKFPELRPFFYVRKIGGENHLKISIGTSGRTIKSK